MPVVPQKGLVGDLRLDKDKVAPGPDKVFQRETLVVVQCIERLREQHIIQRKVSPPLSRRISYAQESQVLCLIPLLLDRAAKGDLRLKFAADAVLLTVESNRNVILTGADGFESTRRAPQYAAVRVSHLYLKEVKINVTGDW